jgi:hypothetical protein
MNSTISENESNDNRVIIFTITADSFPEFNSLHHQSIVGFIFSSEAAVNSPRPNLESRSEVPPILNRTVQFESIGPLISNRTAHIRIGEPPLSASLLSSSAPRR